MTRHADDRDQHIAPGDPRNWLVCAVFTVTALTAYNTVMGMRQEAESQSQ
jgi:hypothetical protein